MNPRSCRSPVARAMRRRLRALVGLALATCVLGGGTAVAATPQTFMSCGSPTQVIGDKTFGGFVYHAHPKSCNYTTDGSEAGRVILESLRWRGWGTATARATGLSRDTHDQDNNGFQRHPIRIAVADRVTINGKRYYTTMQLVIGGQPFTLPLGTPLQHCADLTARDISQIYVRLISCSAARHLLQAPSGANCPRGWRTRYDVVMAGGPKVECSRANRRIYYFTI